MTEHQLSDAHEVTCPNGNTVISHHPHMYPAEQGYKVRPVRGYDDPRGRGFVVVDED